MSRFIIPRINCLVAEVYNERRRTIDYDHYPRNRSCQTDAHQYHSSITSRRGSIRRLRWECRNINFHLKPDMISTTAFFKHSIIDCTCNCCLAYEDRMPVLTRLRSIQQRVIAAETRYR